jgi:UDP-N-acetylglucosamine 4,6-dehydratase/5-epimerase
MARVTNFLSRSKNNDSLRAEFKNKTILVTGGTGSFGRKCINALLTHYSPAKVIVFSRDELKQHEMRADGFTQDNLRFFVGDVRDQERLQRAMNKVDYVIHAAALKQVPTCEYNPMEAIKTNVMGTRNVIEAALDSKVTKVLALSTDKAVNPINLYGATKLCAEKLIVQSNSYAGAYGTLFSCVRYGNVVGSRGSVIPVFLDQRSTGKITITDERMTRFWITLDQGVQFVLNCLGQMQGGEVFIPKIPSMKLPELAQAIAPNCRVDYIGIRPGEKLHEILIAEDESRMTVEMKDMYVIQPAHPWWTNRAWTKGKPVEDGFCYASNNNGWWLSPNELHTLIEQTIPSTEIKVDTKAIVKPRLRAVAARR